jgi:hypothetical protein
VRHRTSAFIQNKSARGRHGSRIASCYSGDGKAGHKGKGATGLRSPVRKANMMRTGKVRYSHANLTAGDSKRARQRVSAKRATLKSPVWEYCTPGSVGGAGREASLYLCLAFCLAPFCLAALASKTISVSSSVFRNRGKLQIFKNGRHGGRPSKSCGTKDCLWVSPVLHILMPSRPKVLAHARE